MRKQTRFFVMSAAVVGIISVMTSCKKECDEIPGYTVKYSTKEKKCVYTKIEEPIIDDPIETKEIEYGSIAEIDSLESKIRLLKKDNPDLKKVIIKPSCQITSEFNAAKGKEKNDLVTWSKLKTKLADLGIEIVLEQNGHWFQPATENQWIYPSEYRNSFVGDWVGIVINIGWNQQYQYAWNTHPDSIPVFEGMGVPAAAFKKIDPIKIDTLVYYASSMPEFTSQKTAMNNSTNKQNTYNILRLTNDMVLSDNNLSNSTVLELVDGKWAGLGSVSPLVVDFNGKKFVPQYLSTTTYNITPAQYTRVNGRVGRNANGSTWYGSCTDKDAFKAKNVDTTNGVLITWDYRPCTIYINDTLFIVNGRDVGGYSAWYATSSAKPNSTQYVKFAGNNKYNIDVTNNFNFSELNQIMIDINNGNLILVPASGKLVPYGKVSADGRVPTLVAANQMGLLKPRTIADTANCWTLLHTDPNKSQMPVFYFTDEVTVPGWNPAKSAAPIINVTANLRADNIPQALYTMPFRIQFRMSPGTAITKMDNQTLDAFSTRAVQNNTLPFEARDATGANLINPAIGTYGATASSTSTTDGCRINNISFGPGTSNSGVKILASWRENSNNGTLYLQKYSHSNMTLNISTTNQNFFESTGNLYVHCDSLANIKMAANVQSPAKISAGYSITVVIPPENTSLWGSIWAVGYQVGWGYVGFNNGPNDKLDDTLEAGKTWWQAGPGGIFSSPSRTR